MNIFPLNLTVKTDELKQLIAEHPDYPIVVLVSEYANTGDHIWMYCSTISYEIKEILDCEVPFSNGYVYSYKDDFEEDLAEWLEDKHNGLSENEFQKIFEEELQKYEPHWKKVIAIYADN